MLTTRIANEYNLPGWRKSAHWLRKIKNLSRTCARACRGGGKNKPERILQTAGSYLDKLYELEEKIDQSIKELRKAPLSLTDLVMLEEIKFYQELLIKHIFLIYDRLIEGKTMQSGDETAEIIPLADRLLNRLGEDNIASLSTDRGFSSASVRELLELYIPLVAMPKKGKLSQADRERQNDKKWRKAANAHSALESDINCLEHHGLTHRCPDKGYTAYSRYVGLGILSYNLHKIGNRLQAHQKEKDKKLTRSAA